MPATDPPSRMDGPRAAPSADQTTALPAAAPAEPEPPPHAEAAIDHDDEPFEEESLDDDPVTEADHAPVDQRPHPLDGVSDAELERRLRTSPDALGSLSIGRPNRGQLLGGVRLPEHDGWLLVDPPNTYGTAETVEFIRRAVERVRWLHPKSHPIRVGHISARRGGALSPHKSHQAGRDVDLGYYYVGEPRWYARATKKNLDVARTWTLVRAFVVETDVELILIDHSIQRLLREHAKSIGEPAAWVDSLFDGTPGGRRALITHARGHATHLHVRFYNPLAQEAARRAHGALARLDLIRPATNFVTHRAKKGETLGMLARKYGTTVRTIQRANSLRSTLILTGREYRVPRKVGIAPPTAVRIPPRRLPPIP